MSLIPKTNAEACDLLEQYAAVLVEACRTHSPATAAAAYDTITAMVGRAFHLPGITPPEGVPDPNVIDKLGHCLRIARDVAKVEFGVDPGVLHYDLRLEAGWLHEDPAPQVWLASVRTVHGGHVRSYANEDAFCALGKLCSNIEQAHEATRKN